MADGGRMQPSRTRLTNPREMNTLQLNAARARLNHDVDAVLLLDDDKLLDMVLMRVLELTSTFDGFCIVLLPA